MTPWPERRRRCAAAALAAAALAARAAAAERPIELSQAIDDALRQNRDLKALALAVESQRIGVSGAAADFEFTLTPQGRAEASDARHSTGYGAEVTRRTEWGTDLGLSARSDRDADAELGDAYRSVVRVSLTQPLLRHAGRLVNREPLTQAERQLLSARRSLELGRADTIVGVVQAHEDLLRLQRQAERDRQAVARLDRFVRLTSLRERQGLATRIDTLRAELRLGVARLRLSGTEDDLRTRRGEYAELLGFPPEEEFAALPAPRLAVTVTNAEEAVAVALTNRLDLAEILQAREDAARGFEIARRGLWPDLDLISRYERDGDGASFSAANRLRDDAWFVGLALSSDLPLRHERAAAGQAELRTQTAALRVESVRAAISRQVRETLNAYARSEAEIPIAERNYAAARSRMRLARRLFEIGKSDSRSVADAEDEFRDAEVNWLNTQASASVAAYRLLRVVGTLVEWPAELKP